MSDKIDISEILAIVKMKEFSQSQYSKNPINVEHICYSGHSVDIYDHSVITASMGSFFKLPITFISSNNLFLSFVDNLKSKFTDLKVVATSLQTKNRLQDYDFNCPILLLVRNETDDLSKFYNENADDFVKISMRDGIDSLNIACATTTCLYEINRQRNF